MKSLRQSSTLMLVAKSIFGPPSTSNLDFNYKLLTVTRSSKSHFLPDARVFPGGNICSADKSRDWLRLYERFGIKAHSFDALHYAHNRPDILHDVDANCDVLPQFLSLRICAIRETFEECGILICRSSKTNYDERIARWASFRDIVDVQKWQTLVYKAPERFLEMCDTFDIYPDVWALKDWMNWATPVYLPTRFDTMFFLACVPRLPDIHIDNVEVQHFEWATPRDYILRNHRKEAALPAPQYYEISRLGHFQDVNVLAKFATDRAVHGVERFLPVKCICDQGVFHLLPGDDLYPEHPETVHDALKLDSLPDSKVHNRFKGMMFDYTLYIQNYQPKFGHVTPNNDLLLSKL